MSFKMGGKGFKKIKDSKDHAILKHHDGHEIKIDKKGLSPKMREMLAALPMGDDKPQKLAAGGAVEDGSEAAPEQPMAQPAPMPSSPQQEMDAIKTDRYADKAFLAATGGNPANVPNAALNPQMTDIQAAKQLIVNKDQDAAAQQAKGMQAQAANDERAQVNERLVAQGYAPLPTPPGQAAPPVGAGMTAGSAPMSAVPDPESGDIQGFNSIATQHMGANAPGAAPGGGMQEAGIRNEAKALGDLGNAQAAIQEREVEDHKAIMADWTKRQDSWNARLDAQEKEITEGKIDPERYMKQHGSLMMTIGMALGSIGQAFTGENAPMKMIQSRIDADINAQKADLGKKETLYSRNLDRYKDDRAAMAATVADMNQVAALKISALAGRSQNAVMGAKAQQMIGALRSSTAAAVGAGTQAQVAGDFEAALRKYPKYTKEGIAAIRKIDPKRADELEAKAVFGYGIAPTPEAAKAVRETAGQHADAKRGINILMGLASKPGASWSMQDRAQADSVSKLMQGSLRTAILGPGTVNDGERAMLVDLIADPTKLMSISGNVKTRLETLMSHVDANLKNQLRVNGMEAPSALTPNQTRDLAIARKNPNAKGAQAVIKLYGDK